MALDLENLKSERNVLKNKLRELEQEQRKLESELKKFRQAELQTKRQIEAHRSDPLSPVSTSTQSK